MDGAFNSLNLFCIVRAALADTSFLFFYVLAMNPISQIKILGRATTVNSLFPSSSVPTCVTHLLFDQSLFSFYFYVSLISCPPFLSSLTHKHLCPDATHGPRRLAPPPPPPKRRAERSRNGDDDQNCCSALGGGRCGVAQYGWQWVQTRWDNPSQIRTRTRKK